MTALAEPGTPVVTSAVTAPPATERRTGSLRLLLGVPLLAKVLGANLLIVVTVASVAVWRHIALALPMSGLALLFGALALSFVVSSVLVLVALRPLRELDRAASRVAAGNLEADIFPDILADQQLTRVGRTLNMLVRGLRADRQRMRRLASLVIRAQDEERARIARELHDSTAQTLAALQLQLSATARANAEGELREEALRERLSELRDLAGAALEEVRLLSHTVYPRILDDLGLPTALEWLARRAREQDSVDVRVEVIGLEPPPRSQAAALYRVAQEAIRNVVRHADAGQVMLRLTVADHKATLEVTDDGRGFDAFAAEARRPGMGLFAMRERVSLVNGTFGIESEPGRGTTVRVSVPMETEDDER